MLIRVVDTGIGISEQHLKQIFEPFEQVDGSTTREFGGTGLGLSIAKDIMEAHPDGKIAVESQFGVGSQFICRFKRASASEMAMQKDSERQLARKRHSPPVHSIVHTSSGTGSKEAPKLSSQGSQLSLTKQSMLASKEISAALKRELIPSASELHRPVEVLSVSTRTESAPLLLEHSRLPPTIIILFLEHSRLPPTIIILLLSTLDCRRLTQWSGRSALRRLALAG